MKLLLSILTFCSISIQPLFAQYYFNDIVATNNTNQLQQLYVKQNIKTIKTVSKESDGSIINDFFIMQSIHKNGNEITTQSQQSSGSKSVLKSFFENGKIVKTINEEDGVSTTSNYSYIDNKLQSIVSGTTDTFITSNSKEEHIWFYKSNSTPEKMFKIKNGKDTTVVNFISDENNLIIEEQWVRNGKMIENYYYYYNDKNWLTDIVRYNNKAKKMLPDFLYEYDTEGRVSKMIQVIAGGTNYNIWVYTYNSLGLKEKEVCYDKKKQLLGTVEYLYNN
ncbi:MAG TPA: hypothetical protein PLU36_02785 [Chitinophagaceae bacterium]|nr:hypothetical protein [Chitinophagaceae bacterium]HNJ57607.1 hypothetical protein [Chitinophagaceae bacterium]